MFMDALSAATTTKKDGARKRKRRPSLTKDTPPASTTAASGTETSASPAKQEKLGADSSAELSTKAASPTSASQATTVSSTNSSDPDATTAPAAAAATSPVRIAAAPMKFYQDTLESRRSTTPEPANEADDDDDSNAAETADEDSTARGRNMLKKGDSIDENSSSDADATPVTDTIASPTREPSADAAENGADKAAASSDSAKITDNDDDNSSGSSSSATNNNGPKGPGPGCGPNGPPGVLLVHRRRGPKKQLRWRPADQLEEVRYFELDETERCNVTKTTASFGDMKQSERTAERDGFAMARKLNGEDTMTEQMAWSTFLFEVEDVVPHPNGAQSKERCVQEQRELGSLAALYFNRLMVPDSPAEPDYETASGSVDALLAGGGDGPIVIPLDDVTGNMDAVTDFTAMPWPEARGSPQLMQQQHGVGGGMLNKGAPPGMVGPAGMGMGVGMMDAMHLQHLHNNNMHGGIQQQQQQQMMAPFVGAGGVGPPGGPFVGAGAPFNGPNSNGGGNWSTNGGGAGVMLDGPPPGFNGSAAPPMMNGAGGGPSPFGPGGGGPPPNQFGGGPPPPFGGAGGPPNGFNDRGGNNHGGAQQPWMRGGGPPRNQGPPGNWRGAGGGGGGPSNRPPWANRTRLCKSFAKGFCRNGDGCNFLHPGINGPMF